MSGRARLSEVDSRAARIEYRDYTLVLVDCKWGNWYFDLYNPAGDSIGYRQSMEYAKSNVDKALTEQAIAEEVKKKAQRVRNSIKRGKLEPKPKKPVLTMPLVTPGGIEYTFTYSDGGRSRYASKITSATVTSSSVSNPKGIAKYEFYVKAGTKLSFKEMHPVPMTEQWNMLQAEIERAKKRLMDFKTTPAKSLRTVVNNDTLQVTDGNSYAPLAEVKIQVEVLDDPCNMLPSHQACIALKDGQIISKVTGNFLPQLVLEQNPGIQVIEDDSGYQRLISADMVAGYQAAMREINALYAQMQEQRAEPKAALEAELLNFVALQTKYQDDLRVWEDTRDALRSGPSDTA